MPEPEIASQPVVQSLREAHLVPQRRYLARRGAAELVLLQSNKALPSADQPSILMACIEDESWTVWSPCSKGVCAPVPSREKRTKDLQ